MTGFFRFIFFACMFASSAGFAVENLANIQLDVTKYKLDNSMKVLLLEDHSAPFFTLQIWYDVGSKHEKPGLTGLAHFFEHYMFKGTNKYPFPMYEQTVSANGGTFNAFTTRDYTAYYVNMPSDKLELAMDMESDRIRNLTFDAKKVQSEREVVKEERRMRYENDIGGLINERLFKSVFKVHPYSWPVIGSMVDLNRASLKDLEDFYRVHYAPNNAMLILVGDFSTSQAKKLIDKYFANIPSQSVPEYKSSSEPEQRSERQVKVEKDVQNATVMIGFPTVKAGDTDMFALDLASTILGAGTSSRLYRKLVYQQQAATGVSSWSMTIGDTGLMTVSASLKPGQGSSSALQSIYGELYKLRAYPVSDAELEKAKNMVMKDYVSGLKTLAGKARTLAVNEMYYGDYREAFKDLDRYMAVTKEQIQKVAEKYFLPQHRNVIVVEPKAGG